MDDLALTEQIEVARISGHRSWDYHSRASRAHLYVAMTVPKVACTTIKMALQTWERSAPEPERSRDVHDGWAGHTLMAYPTAQIIEMLRSPDYLRFGFVRNPYSRLVSAWKSKLAQDDPDYPHLRAAIREACGYPRVDGQRSGRVAFRDAVECLFANQGEFDFDDHWTRQVDLLIPNVIDYHVVGRFERFSQDFPAILRRLRAPTEVMDMGRRTFNPTPPMALAAVYDRQLAERVYDYYIADFETFGYRKDSWHFEGHDETRRSVRTRRWRSVLASSLVRHLGST